MILRAVLNAMGLWLVVGMLAVGRSLDYPSTVIIELEPPYEEVCIAGVCNNITREAVISPTTTQDMKDLAAKMLCKNKKAAFNDGYKNPLASKEYWCA